MNDDRPQGGYKLPKVQANQFFSLITGSPQMPTVTADWVGTLHDSARAQFADDIEAEGSLLCDCRRPGGSPPTNARTLEPLAHHCECRAVVASAIVRQGMSDTLHHLECVCGEP